MSTLIKQEPVDQDNQTESTPQPAQAAPGVKPNTRILDPSASNGKNIYEVEKIVDMKTAGAKKTLYKVRWKGFPETEDTWVPYENLSEGRDQLIAEFKEIRDRGIARVKEEKVENSVSGGHEGPSKQNEAPQTTSHVGSQELDGLRNGASGSLQTLVEKIVERKVAESGEILYKVRWKGFPEIDDSWESYENLPEEKDTLIMEYNQKIELQEKGGAIVKQEKVDDSNVNATGSQEAYQTASYVESQNDDDDTRNVMRRSTSKNRESADYESDRSGSIRHNHTHWQYETVEVMTPEEWNRFGNLESREIGRLYIPDRIPTETEKLLCNFSPDVGRVTRNKLKSVLKTEPSPSKDSSPAADEPPRKRRKKPTNTSDGLRSEFKKEPVEETEPSAASDSTAEQPTFDSVCILPKAEVLDDAVVMTSKKAQENTEVTSGREKTRRGRGRGRGRPRSRSRPISPTPGSSLPERQTSVGASTGSNAKSKPTSRPSQIGNWRVLADMSPSPSDEFEPQLQIAEPSTDKEAREVEVAVPREGVTTERQKKQEGPPPGTVAALHFASREARLKNRRARARDKLGAPRTQRKQKQKTAMMDGKNEFLDDFASTSQELEETSLQALESKANDHSQFKVLNATSLMLLESADLPFPVTDRSLDTVWMDAIRTHQSNREKPLTSFSEYRQAALAGDISKVRWTGRCVPERRGFNINTKYRGKTIPVELCEKPCNPSHNIDDMLVQMVRDGMRLDITEDVKGRIPLHFAIENSFLCRVELLLHLRSPVNLMDKDKKTPMDLIMIGRGKPAMQEQMVLQLLRYGADADDALKKLPPVLPPHRQGCASILLKHQQKVNSAFDGVRTKTLIDMAVKRILTQVYVRPIWESERYGLTTEIGFGYKTVIFPNNRYTYTVLLALADFRNPKSWRLRMWGKCPFKEVSINGTPLQRFIDGNGFVYMARRLQEGWNILSVKYNPEFRRKRLLLLAQVLLMQVRNPPVVVPQPVLERAADNGTDFKTESAS